MKRDQQTTGWLDNFNDSKVSLPEGFVGEGTINGPKFTNGAINGPFKLGGNIPGSVGFSYARTKNIPDNGPYAKKTLASAKNGITKDNNGYWDPKNWGKPVEIDSGDITMKGVNQPLLGIGKQSGDKKLMKPGKNYNFANDKQVIELPLSKNGKSLTELDQLTNFTNYNTPQPGGWLDNL